MKVRIEFNYNPRKDITDIFVWDGYTTLLDKLEMNGQLTSYTKKKIREELKKDYEEKK